MDAQHARVRPNWVALSIVLAAGLAAGLLPFLLYMRVPYLVVPFAVYALIAVSLQVRRFAAGAENATEHPEPLEWLLAGWHAVGLGATASIIAFVWYWLAWAVVWGARYGAHAVGWTIETTPVSGGTYASVFFAGIFALAIPFLAADDIPSKLYPRIAGTRSAYFPLTASPRWLTALAAIGIAGTAAGVAFTDVHGLGFTLTLTLFIVATAGHLFDLREAERPSSGVVTVLKACSTLLSAAGYKLTEKPRTGNPEVDPLITPVDLLASAGNHGYAIKVKVAGSDEKDLDWTAASDIRRAAKTLQRVLGSDSPDEVKIEAYLLVIGGRVSDDLRSFSEEEDVKLVQFPTLESLSAALKPEASASDLRGIAERLLKVSPGMPAGNAPSVVASR